MTTEIQLSKSKLISTLLGSTVFVLIGFWFVTNPPSSNHGLLSNPVLVRIVGAISILFFGIVTVYVLKKLRDKSPGLVISHDGLIDNASGVSAGFIPWTDVLQIEETIVANQKFVNVIVKNPQDYIDKQTNAFKRKMVQINYKTYNSVISIPAVSLKCDFEELKAMLNKGFLTFKQSQANKVIN